MTVLLRIVPVIYGPDDGGEFEVPAEAIDEGCPVLRESTLTAPRSGTPLLARYVVAEHAETHREVLVFDGWYVNRPGDSYGPRTGGLTEMEGQ